jgi:hypothetical protein
VQDFDLMTPRRRLAWLQRFQQVHQTTGWFNAIEGVLILADHDDLVQPGSWSSMVDANILVSYQDGLRITKRLEPVADNPASTLWATFFVAKREPRPDERTLLQLWGSAEQATTDFGVAEAYRVGRKADPYDRALLDTSQIFRAAVRTGAAAGIRDHYRDSPASGISIVAGSFDPRNRDLPVFLGHISYGVVGGLYSVADATSCLARLGAGC